MAKYLIKTVETYRVDSEEEAVKFIEEAKASNKYSLVKYTNEHKEKKQKGEIIDEYNLLSFTKVFNDVNDPYSTMMVDYHKPGESESAF